MSPRRIAVFTATRAEYGLLRPIVQELHSAEDLECLLVVAGAHLSSSHGYTVSEIERDGFPIAARVVALLDNDSSLGTSYSMALTLQGVASALADLEPDIFIILGDRYEAMAAASAAMMARIPIAHLHGGEATEGLIDEAIRHSITKMAHLHLVAAELFRRRVIQLGEDPDSVHVVGAPGLDNIRNMPLMDRADLDASLGWEPGHPYLLVTHHPVTLRPELAQLELEALLAALSRQSGHRVLFTAPNADQEGGTIRRRLEAFVSDDPQRFYLVTSLGQARYLSAVKHAAAVVGNSSSGLIEAPFLGTATVNVGDRQRGRIQGPTVLHCRPDPDEISAAIRQAVRLEAAPQSLYGDGRTAPRVVDRLRNASLDDLLVKSFHDLVVPP